MEHNRDQKLVQMIPYFQGDLYSVVREVEPFGAAHKRFRMLTSIWTSVMICDG